MPSAPGAVSATTIGVLGGSWRADVTSWGGIAVWDGGGTLDWYVAADDRWHDPSREASVRQTRLDGAPVLETRVRVPQGDVVQRIHAVADHGGLTIVELENDSPLPVAVALAGLPVLSVRAPASVPVEGIDLPIDTPVFPIGHRSTITVAIAHAQPRVGTLPASWSGAPAVARGWTTVCERASRFVLPDASIADSIIAARCRLMLDGPFLSAPDDPVASLLGIGELVRLGAVAADWMPELAETAGALADVDRRDPLLGAALDAAVRVAIAADDRRARRDLDRLGSRLGRGDDASVSWTGATDEAPARFVARIERCIASGPLLLPAGLPPTWLGQPLEVYGVPTAVDAAVSFALRWHGARPAVLWEQTGVALPLESAVAPGWRSAEPTGEALWPAPPGAPTISDPMTGDVSFD
jgi:hypothetical protein